MNKPFIANMIIGGALIVLGIITLFANIFQLDLNLRFWWPLFILVPGITMGLTYIAARQARSNLLIPSVILTIYGVTFFLNNIASMYLGSSSLWATTIFVYPGAVAVAMWISWNTQGRQMTHLVPAIILTTVSGLILCFTFFTTILADILGGHRNASLIAPLLLICIGLVVVGLPAAVSTSVKKTWKSKFPSARSGYSAGKAESQTADTVLEAEIVQDKE